MGLLRWIASGAILRIIPALLVLVMALVQYPDLVRIDDWAYSRLSQVLPVAEIDRVACAESLDRLKRRLIGLAALCRQAHNVALKGDHLSGGAGTVVTIRHRASESGKAHLQLDHLREVESLLPPELFQDRRWWRSLPTLEP